MSVRCVAGCGGNRRTSVKLYARYLFGRGSPVKRAVGATNCLDTHRGPRYGRGLMARHSTASRLALLVTAALFLCLGIVSAGHLHGRTTADAVKSECQLCALGQARVDQPGAALSLFGLIALAGALAHPLAVAARRHARALPSLRAPPSR